MKKYKDADGNYLAVDDGANYIRVGWYIPEWGDFGAYIGEKTGKESRILNRLASDFLGIDAMKYNGAFVFDSTRQAKEFLAVANTALINEPMANWPTWAIEAHNAGWTPPKGWTPKRGRK